MFCRSHHELQSASLYEAPSHVFSIVSDVKFEFSGELMIPRSLHWEYVLLPLQLANNPWDDILGPFKYSVPHSLSSHDFSTH